MDWRTGILASITRDGARYHSYTSVGLGVKFGKRKIHYPSNVNEEEETRCYSASEIAAILTTATGQYKALFTLAAETGMRAGELYGLHVDDIDCDRHVVHVRRSMWS